MNDDALRELARQAGVAVEWTDNDGVARQVSVATLRAMLGALGLLHADARDISRAAAQADFVAREHAVVTTRLAPHDVAIDEVRPFIDWTFFFSAWEMPGRVPAIFDHPRYGAAARELYDHAQTLLDEIAGLDTTLHAESAYDLAGVAGGGILGGAHPLSSLRSSREEDYR